MDPDVSPRRLLELLFTCTSYASHQVLYLCPISLNEELLNKLAFCSCFENNAAAKHSSHKGSESSFHKGPPKDLIATAYTE